MGIEGEANFYRIGRRGKKILLEEISVGPGDVMPINNADSIKAMGVVNIQDTRGTIRAKKRKRLNGRLFKAGDEDGKAVDLSKPVFLEDGDQLTLSTPTKTGLREVILWFDSSNDDHDGDQIIDPIAPIPVLI